MNKYFIKKLLIAIFTLLIISFVIFVTVRIIPGNPFPTSKMSQEQIEQKRAELGLDDPILIQYGRYMSSLLRGDFGNGTSLYQGVPIKSVLGTCIANSFRIGGLAILIGVFAGVLIGIFAALYKGKLPDKFCSFISIAGICMPSYVFFIYFQRYFCIEWNIFPILFDEKQFFQSSVLPAVCMSLFSIATIAKFTRNEMVEVMKSDYIKLVEAKGIYGPKLIFSHVIRNALISIITVMAPMIIGLLTGATIIERIYGINGIGNLFVDAISGEGVDYNYILILSLLFSAMYIFIMLILDVLYGIIDPRISAGKKK